MLAVTSDVGGYPLRLEHTFEVIAGTSDNGCFDPDAMFRWRTTMFSSVLRQRTRGAARWETRQFDTVRSVAGYSGSDRSPSASPVTCPRQRQHPHRDGTAQLDIFDISDTHLSSYSGYCTTNSPAFQGSTRIKHVRGIPAHRTKETNNHSFCPRGHETRGINDSICNM